MNKGVQAVNSKRRGGEGTRDNRREAGEGESESESESEIV